MGLKPPTRKSESCKTKISQENLRLVKDPEKNPMDSTLFVNLLVKNVCNFCPFSEVRRCLVFWWGENPWRLWDLSEKCSRTKKNVSIKFAEIFVESTKDCDWPERLRLFSKKEILKNYMLSFHKNSDVLGFRCFRMHP